MAEGLYFIRCRGKISGPHDLAGLQRLVKRGALSRMHEISSDRRSWTSAGLVEDLFPHPAAVAAPVEAAVTTAPAGGSHRGAAPEYDVGDEGASASSSAASAKYFYSQGGSAVGPLPLAVLKALAQNGTLGPNDMVWPEDAATATPAYQVTHLAAIFSGGMPAQQHASAPAPTGKDVNAARRAMENIGNANLIWGISLGIVLLFCLNIPVGSINNKLIWWWDALKLPDSGLYGVSCFTILFSGIALCIITPLLTGMARGIALLGVGTTGWVVLLTLLLSTPGSDATSVVGFMIPVLLPALIGVCYFRMYAPRETYGRVLQGVFGGLLSLSVVIVSITAMATDTEINVLLPFHKPPPWVVFAMILGVISTAAMFAAGVMGIIGLKPVFTKTLNTATSVCAIVGLLVSILAAIVLIIGISDTFSPRSPGLYAFAMLRILAIYFALIALTGCGVAEWLMAIRYQSFAYPTSRGNQYYVNA